MVFKLELDIELTYFCFTIFIAFIALLFVLFDVHYFVRVVGTVVWSKYFQKRIDLYGETTIYGFCSTTDLDFVLKHMNNARFVREMDFARIQFYIRTGLYDTVRKAKGDLVQTASTIRHRRVVPLFTAYKITTKLLYWNEKAFYIEQKLISLSDGFVRAIVMSEQKTVRHSVEDTVKAILKEDSPDKPTLEVELDHWIKSMEASSAKLRKKD